MQDYSGLAASRDPRTKFASAATPTQPSDVVGPSRIACGRAAATERTRAPDDTW